MADTEMEILQGIIGSVIFQNYDNGYAVLRLNCENGQCVTVVGTIPLPSAGERLMVTGKWSNHASYGRQFEAEFLERMMPQTSQDILQYLSSRAVKGIGPKIAARIVNRFGDQALIIMEREPERLAEVSGISPARAHAIGEAFRLQVGMRQLMEFFALHQLPAELAVKTYKIYGEQTIDLLYDDPYLLMDPELEAPFAAVDRFAIALGISADDHRRLEAGVLFELQYNLLAGHVFLPEDKLIAATAQLLSVGTGEIAESIQRLIHAQQLVRQQLAGIVVIYLWQLYEAEVFCCRRLQEFAQTVFPAPAALEKKLKIAASTGNVEYSPAQADAIREAATCGMVMITGGPGTGKTTIVQGILSLYEQMGLKTLLCAPTGRAAKRLTEVTGQDASTIHRLLEAGIDPHSGKLFFQKDGQNPLRADAVIIDEMSMVDIELLHNLFQAIRPGTRMIFVGDPDQLPPVGPGFPFSDMLRCGSLPAIRLTEIFRQAQQSLIVMNAHRVNQGIMPELKNVKSDFFFIRAASEDQAAQTIAQLCATRLPNNMGISPDQIQVLSPTKKGGAGTFELNRLLQQQLNPAAPGKPEKKFGEYIFRVGDRVMQVRNNYDILWKKDDGTIGAGMFNGDVGTIVCIDTDSELLSVLFDDRTATYDFTELNELEPAYAVTVHKSQGSEYRAVVLCAWNGSAYLLNRSVLYTGITRAKNLLVIVGREDTIRTMTENAKTGRRYTGLKLRLQEKVL